MARTYQGMTSEQASDRFLCQECRDGGWCEHDCVLSMTCSFICPDCKESVYFAGDLHNQTEMVVCHCGHSFKNKFFRKKR